MTHDYIPFSEIVAEIAQLSKQKVTGTLFISTQDNRSAQVMLDKGEIVYVFFSSKRGEEALALMSTIREGRYRFQEGSAIARRMQLPPTAAILQALAGGATGSTASPVQGQETRKVLVGNGLSAEQKGVLESCMAECIGPMAAIICEDYFNSIGDLSSMVDALAAEIPSPLQAKKISRDGHPANRLKGGKVTPGLAGGRSGPWRCGLCRLRHTARILERSRIADKN